MNSSRFFQNKECEYFPCHKDVAIEHFNCLFCFCPWFYHCGNLKSNICKCEDCNLPHIRNNYDMIMVGIQNIREAGAEPK